MTWEKGNPCKRISLCRVVVSWMVDMSFLPRTALELQNFGLVSCGDHLSHLAPLLPVIFPRRKSKDQTPKETLLTVSFHVAACSRRRRPDQAPRRLSH